jgi:hypothetical protein
MGYLWGRKGYPFAKPRQHRVTQCSRSSSDSTYLVDSLDFLITGDTGIGPGVRDLSKLGSHHRAFHSGRRELGDIVDIGRCGTSEGRSGRVSEEWTYCREFE